ncbi:protein spinster homolog 1-like isoform X2 [Ptychodera flava]|uniref:protein spinster homolog 1-like isoform X2 n=1 Tax=Ptychodera flava TaxID=63121 RepID=UPI00396A19D9
MSIHFDRSTDQVNVDSMSGTITDESPTDPYGSETEVLLNRDDALPKPTELETPTEEGSSLGANSGPEEPGKRGYITVGILFYVNLLNYMDRFTVAGNLKKIQQYYSLNDAEGGLLQTVFIIMYMIAAPLFGYLGDRYNRKIIMSVGIFLWSCFTVLGSLVPAHWAPAFFVLRGLVGVGEASYSTIAPTIIADLFSKGMRTRMLAVFYFAIPVGSGLGYIIGTYVGQALGAWQWGLRVTPVFGVIAIFLILILVKEPKRGASDDHSRVRATSYGEDLRALLKTPSYIWSTFGFVGVAWVAGCLSWWAPTYIEDAYTLSGKDGSSTALIFGGITVVTGILGVALGAEIARRWKKYNPRADPLVCGIGLIGCSPFLYFVITLAHKHHIISWILIFFGETFLSLNWAVTADILLYVVIPTRRSTANAFQMLLSHTLGDATSPYIVGQPSLEVLLTLLFHSTWRKTRRKLRMKLKVEKSMRCLLSILTLKMLLSCSVIRHPTLMILRKGLEVEDARVVNHDPHIIDAVETDSTTGNINI